MASSKLSNAGKIALALAFVAGIAAISRAVYNCSQSGELDFGKIALGIGIPCLIYTIVRNTESKN